MKAETPVALSINSLKTYVRKEKTNPLYIQFNNTVVNASPDAFGLSPFTGRTFITAILASKMPIKFLKVTSIKMLVLSSIVSCPTLRVIFTDQSDTILRIPCTAFFLAGQIHGANIIC